jgi:Beta-lactamase
VRIDDRFHTGSDTKAFTSLLAGQFVEAQELRWNSTPADVFPELKDKMNAEFAKITLEELLSHSSGLTDGPQLLDLINRSYQQEEKTRNGILSTLSSEQQSFGLACEGKKNENTRQRTCFRSIRKLGCRIPSARLCVQTGILLSIEGSLMSRKSIVMVSRAAVTFPPSGLSRFQIVGTLEPSNE